jgi:hypothetical protein
MPAYSGKFQYLDEAGASLQQGPCELSFDEETCTITPPSGLPVTFDLGDVDAVEPGEWEIALRLCGGAKTVLRQFGPAFDRMVEELLAAWRDRTVRCLLLEDLEELARFSGVAAGIPAEIRIYGSNLAVLPVGGRAQQWRLAEVDSITFDEATYTVTVARGSERLSIGKLAKKTEEFAAALAGAHEKLRCRTSEVLHRTFPFLNAGQLQRATRLMPEGRSVKLTALSAIHPKLPEALVTRAVDEPMRPYFDALRAKAVPDSLMAGFKFVRQDESESEDGEAGTPGVGASEDAPPLFFWFFFPLKGRDIAAWEATTGSGRATYFFRAPSPVEDAIANLTRGLALVNFRREPIYLSDDSLEQQARFHRYAIGCRKLPELPVLRRAFLGRAVHSSMEEWLAQAGKWFAAAAADGPL